MYEKFLSPEGLLVIAGHRFDPVTHTCTYVSSDRKCRRKLCDVLSDAAYAKVNDLGIACYGQLTYNEHLSLLDAYNERKKAIENANKVR